MITMITIGSPFEKKRKRINFFIVSKNIEAQNNDI